MDNEKAKVSVELSSSQLKMGYILLFSILGGSPLYFGYTTANGSDKEISSLVKRMDNLIGIIDEIEDYQEDFKDKTNHRVTVLEINQMECLRTVRGLK